MTSTDELRKMLDERGVDYEVRDLSNIKFFHDTRWNANGVHWCYTEIVGATTCLTMCNEWKDCTPEQAIAATLGDDDYEHRMDELLCRLTNGKWSKSRSYSVDFMVSCVDEAYEDATLGGGECEWELEHGGTLYDKWRCSECKFLFVEPRCDQGYTDLVPNFCPRCGKAVKR